jgi:hypothetical protein
MGPKAALKAAPPQEKGEKGDVGGTHRRGIGSSEADGERYVTLKGRAATVAVFERIISSLFQ